MASEFEQRLIDIENELLRLKSSKEYSSLLPAFLFKYTVRTGYYKITYDMEPSDDLLAYFAIQQWLQQEKYHIGGIGARPQEGNTQVVEVRTSNIGETRDCEMTVYSNWPVAKIERIG